MDLPKRMAKINGMLVDFQEIKTGDEFELFEPDGESIGKFRADGNPVPFPPPEWNYKIECTKI